MRYRRPREPLALPRADRVEKARMAFSTIDTGRLAQLVRAPRLHRGGWGFESLVAHYSCLQRPAVIRRVL